LRLAAWLTFLPRPLPLFLPPPVSLFTVAQPICAARFTDAPRALALSSMCFAIRFCFVVYFALLPVGISNLRVATLRTACLRRMERDLLYLLARRTL
jgi:hypothetical protein